MMTDLIWTGIFAVSFFVLALPGGITSLACSLSENKGDYDIGIHTDRGMVNPENEDTCGFYIAGQDIVCVVYDGVGGSAGGRAASRIAFRVMREYIDSNGIGPGMEGIRKSFSEAFVLADVRVKEFEESDSLLRGMATTCLAAVVRNDTLYYCHSGDCRLYIGDSQGLKQMTEDDSYINMLLADGEITEKEARRHPLRRAIINAIGSETNELYVNFCAEGVPVSDGMYYLLCSDGLYEELSPKRIHRIVMRDSGMTSTDISERLVRSANRAGGGDNISAVVIRKQVSK